MFVATSVPLAVIHPFLGSKTPSDNQTNGSIPSVPPICATGKEGMFLALLHPGTN